MKNLLTTSSLSKDNTGGLPFQSSLMLESIKEKTVCLEILITVMHYDQDAF